MSEAVLSAVDLHKRYRQGPLDVSVLHGVNLDIRAGESVAVVGASGSGKSSLMHLLAGLDAPTQGHVEWSGERLSSWGLAELGRRRNLHLGFVFQFHHLLPELDAVDNVAIPLWIRRVPTALARQQALEALQQVGLGQRSAHRPAELSGGERQRVALARAMVTRPACLLADEPTGNLDRDTAQDMFGLLLNLCDQQGTALVMVTHDETLAARCDRLLRLQHGQLEE
ncbi:MAG: ATP-binding cassette domain-containing protein [Alphaproteobacteria bacterium]|nr:ATP-binding cassette domain-containing protein [Alphaproteobacteria bacterium]